MEKSGFLILAVLFGLVNSLTYTIDNAEEPLRTVSETFLSVALDTGLLSSVNFSNPNFSPLVKHLAPMHFRVGGTAADTVLFEDNSLGTSRSTIGDVIIDSSLLLEIAEFTKKSGVHTLLDLNSLLRNSDGSWDSSNAEQLIKFASENMLELDFELGNEPDLYHALFDTSVTAQQLSEDYTNLRSLLDQYGYSSSYLVGPSMFDVGSSTDTKNYLSNFLSGVGSAIDAVTWHQYYFNGRSATEDLFLNPSTFNYLEQRTKVVTDIAGSGRKVWLGETSSCYNQGAAGFTDRFIGSFLWLDKLGLGAKLGLDVIVRQTIWGYNYPLLSESYLPNPDWWVAILYKTLVGTKVLSNTNDGEDSRSIRLYAHCAKSNTLWGNSAVVVFGLNLDSEEGSFSLAGFESKSESGYLYELTSESDLYSQTVQLNGENLHLSDDLELPVMEPKTVNLKESITISGYSLVFLVIPETDVAACLV